MPNKTKKEAQIETFLDAVGDLVSDRKRLESLATNVNKIYVALYLEQFQGDEEYKHAWMHFVFLVENYGDEIFRFRLGDMLPTNSLTVYSKYQALDNPTHRLAPCTPSKDEFAIERQLPPLPPIEAILNVNELKSTLTCRTCKDSTVISEERQTRAADEGSTVYAFCLKCKKRWRMC